MDDGQAGAEPGRERVLLKPFNRDYLLTMVAKMLTAQKVIDQARERDPADNAWHKVATLSAVVTDGPSA